MLLLSTALAHVPHVMVMGVAVPHADESWPWYIGSVCETPTSIYRSDDAGETWVAISSPAMQDDLLDGAYIDDGTAILGGADRYWTTTDGSDWAGFDLPFTLPSTLSPYAGGDQLYLAAESGIWVAAADGTLTLDLDVAAASVHDGEDGPVALGELGDVFVKEGGVWTGIGRPTRERLWGATSGGGHVWIGTQGGRVWDWDGRRWSACGETGLALLDGPHAMIAHLAYRSGRLWATATATGPAVSTDLCTTWTHAIAPPHNDFQEDGTGSYTDDARAYVTLTAIDERVLIASFDGLGLSTDAGQSWRAPAVVGGDFVEGLTFSNNFETDGTLLLAGYGSGLVRVTDFGATFWAEDTTYAQPNSQDVLVARAADSLTPALAIINMELYRSDDEGQTWQGIDGPFSIVRLMDRAAGERFYAIDISADHTPPGGFLRSDDGGVTWGELANYPKELAAQPVANIADAGGWLCAQSRSSAACSYDDGLTWSILPIEAGTTVQNLELWPADAPTVVLVSTSSGLWRYDGATMVEVRPASEPRMQYLTATDDGHLFGLDIVGALWQSDDGGQRWSDTGARIPGQARVLMARSGFAAHPDVLIGGVDGVFRVRDGVVERFAAYQRVEDGTRYLRCEGCAGVDDTTAALRHYTLFDATDQGEIYLRGSTLRIRGASPTGAVVRVSTDGSEIGSVTVPPQSALDGTPVEITGLTDAWHRLTFTIDVGELLTDGFEGQGASVTLAHAPEDTGDLGETGETGETADDEPGETAQETADESADETADDTSPTETPVDGGCGCASSRGGRGGLWGLSGLVLPLLRRRAPRPS